MNGLVRVTSESPLTFLKGYLGRIIHIEGDGKQALVEIEERAKTRFNMRMHKLSINTLELITDGEKTLVSSLPLLAWPLMNRQEKASAIKAALQVNFNECYEDFERIQLKAPSFLDAFVLEVMYHRDSHQRHGGRANFEELRYHSYLKDASTEFNVNNNYLSSIALLVTTLFPGLSGFFEHSPSYWVNSDLIVLPKVMSSGYSWFTEELLCINDSNLGLSYFSNNINSELGFGIH